MSKFNLTPETLKDVKQHEGFIADFLRLDLITHRASIVLDKRAYAYRSIITNDEIIFKLEALVESSDFTNALNCICDLIQNQIPELEISLIGPIKKKEVTNE